MEQNDRIPADRWCDIGNHVASRKTMRGTVMIGTFEQEYRVCWDCFLANREDARKGAEHGTDQ